MIQVFDQVQHRIHLYGFEFPLFYETVSGHGSKAVRLKEVASIVAQQTTNQMRFIQRFLREFKDDKVEYVLVFTKTGWIRCSGVGL